VERNGALEERPELVNEQPYGDGWLVAIDPTDPAELGALLDASAYQEHVSSS
jgi:glycine cleavage system H protein